jgi:hypothetical protein
MRRKRRVIVMLVMSSRHEVVIASRIESVDISSLLFFVALAIEWQPLDLFSQLAKLKLMDFIRFFKFESICRVHFLTFYCHHHHLACRQPQTNLA